MAEKDWENRVAYLGPEGTFTHLATKRLFKEDWQIPMKTIPECIEAVSEGQVDFAIVPIENALEGIVPLTIDYLYHEANLFIAAEIAIPIAQHLMVHPDHAAHWETIDHIYSHSHALAQCHKYLYYRLRSVPQDPKTSTAAAAKYVSEHPEERIAAIANEAAAEQYGLTIVERNIHDFHFNHTRFFVLSKSNIRLERLQQSEQMKTTLMVKLPNDNPGALHQLLSVFAWRKLNLSKIESRPLKTKLGDYFFIVDILADEREPMMTGAMEELRALGCSVKSLGSYHMFDAQ
ncbi:prephenate dehydratase [Kurthia massiliensis]|uniref:prephenate dehydratase n=1 Tax=Kurthia massiliensis TaxID=1033739 RepID=UPI00028A181B|nr:prephenate dehydratase [Kurthia massiliensis]